MHLSSRGESEKCFPPFFLFCIKVVGVPFFSDFTRKWVVKGWWINEGGLPSYFQQAWPPAPASLTAVWTPKTFQTNFPFPDILLTSKDAQSGRDFQYLCSGSIERHWRDKLLGDDSKTLKAGISPSQVRWLEGNDCSSLISFVEIQLGKDFWSQFHYNLIPTQLVLISKRLWRAAEYYPSLIFPNLGLNSAHRFKSCTIGRKIFPRNIWSWYFHSLVKFNFFSSHGRSLTRVA